MSVVWQPGLRVGGLVFLLAVVSGGAGAAAGPASAPFDDPRSISLEDYLPATEQGFDENLPRPESVLGHEIGSGFARHDLIVAWFRELAAASPRVEVIDIGRTYEGRPQITAIITSTGNQRNLTRLQERHVDGNPAGPVFIWLGYSVHGNESSGTQASLAVAWYLAASLDPAVEELLKNSVIMIDPSLNPDGYGRFSNWGNQATGRMPVAEPANRDRAEPWPGGRTNHYFFDLNRDWLLLQHPESRNRVRFLQQFRPHVMTDHHEMSADNTFFFQPGVATRAYPLIPQENQRLTAELGKFHARALDGARRLYYSGESFDDFYPGKGSTWPDLQGTVGILFEQASTRGLIRDSAQGRLTLPMAVHNHVLASLSSIRGAVALGDELKAYRRAYDNAELVPAGLPAGWLFDDGGDPARAQALLDVLQGQGLDVFGLTASVRVENLTFEPGRAWVVPVLGPRAALAHALFATTRQFADSTFYDVSAWSLPAAFGVRAVQVRRMPTALDPDARVEQDLRVRGPRGAVAWAMPWDNYFAPAVLHRLQRAGIRTRVALDPFTGVSDGREVEFNRGTVIVHAADLAQTDERPVDVLTRIADGDALLVGLDSGLTSDGPELGSPRVVPLKESKVAIVAGDGVNGYAAGNVWHLLDYRLGIPTALVKPTAINEQLLERHTHLFIVDGRYASISEDSQAALLRWVEGGGVLILTRRAISWAQDLDWLPKPEKSDVEDKADENGARYPYAEMAARDGARQIGGAVLEIDLDRTHPLGFGIHLDSIGLLRRGRISLAAPGENPFAAVGVYSNSPLVNGYLPEGYADELAGKPAIVAVPRGRGVIIGFADDPGFRAVWWVGQRLLSNAVAFGEVIRAPKEKYVSPAKGGN